VVQVPTKVASRSTITTNGGPCVGMGGVMLTHELCATSSATLEELMLSVEISLDQVSLYITRNISYSKF
jgi:hypothetical protein